MAAHYSCLKKIDINTNDKYFRARVENDERRVGALLESWMN